MPTIFMNEIRKVWIYLTLAVLIVSSGMAFFIIRDPRPQPAKDRGGQFFRVVNHTEYYIFVEGYVTDPLVEDFTSNERFLIKALPNDITDYEDSSYFLPDSRGVMVEIGRGGNSKRQMILDARAGTKKIKDIYVTPQWMPGKGWKLVIQKKLINTRVKA